MLNKHWKETKAISRIFFGDEVILTANDVPDSNIEFDRALNEWNALGFYLNSHPLEEKKKEVRNMCGFISELQSETHRQRGFNAI